MTEIKKDLSKNFFSESYFGDKSLIKYIKAYLSGQKKSNYFNYQSLADNPKYWDSMLKIITKYDKRGGNGNFLDIGCALGLLLKYASPHFKEIYGYDISEFAIKQAQKNAPMAKLTAGNINTDNLPYKDEFFDFIIALEILEHTKSVELSLKKIVPKLKKDGILVISLPIRGTFWGKIFQIFDIDKSHIDVPRNEKEIFDIIDRVGLRAIEINRSMFTPWGEIKGIAVSVRIVLQKK